MPSVLAKSQADLDRAAQAIRGLSASPDKPFEITWQEYKQTRSAAANRLYWKWIHHIAAETGNDPQDVHEAFKVMFLGVETVVIKGVECPVVKSSADLKVKAFSEYLMRIESWCKQNGIYLPSDADYERVFK